MERWTELPLSAQTGYAQLLDAAIAANLGRDVADLRGSFASKRVKGRDYWYFQFTGLTGKLHQLYVGPASSELETIIAQHRAGGRNQALIPLARAAEALGCTAVHRKHYLVLDRLSEYGFFGAGGVLIGTHAFLAHGNMLGLRWSLSPRTEDLDFAHWGRDLAIALPANVEVDTHAAVESLSMGFIPVSTLSGIAGPTYLNPKQPEFRLDFVTTRDRRGDAPWRHEALGVTVQPLAYLEYLLVDVAQAVLFCGRGAVVVTVPNPARYALHKLVVYGERKGSFRTKANKDIHQAAALLDYLCGIEPDSVEAAWDDLVGRGPSWRKRAGQGLQALHRYAPDIQVPVGMRV